LTRIVKAAFMIDVKTTKAPAEAEAFVSFN